MVIFFDFSKLLFFFFVVAICDLVHDVETMYGVMLPANSILKSFLKYLLQIAVSRASLMFQKRFPDAVSS